MSLYYFAAAFLSLFSLFLPLQGADLQRYESSPPIGASKLSLAESDPKFKQVYQKLCDMVRDISKKAAKFPKHSMNISPDYVRSVIADTAEGMRNANETTFKNYALFGPSRPFDADVVMLGEEHANETIALEQLKVLELLLRQSSKDTVILQEGGICLTSGQNSRFIFERLVSKEWAKTGHS